MSRPTRDGVSLIEIIVAVAIIVIAIGLLMPATRRVRTSAARVQCSNNLKQLTLAFHAFESTNRVPAHPPSDHPDTPADRFLPAGCYTPGTTPDGRLSWAVALLPYLEQNALYERFDVNKDYAANLHASQEPIKTFHCPAAELASPTDAITCYIAMAGIGYEAPTRPAGAAGNGFMGFDRRTSFAMMTDGTSNTIALMETRSRLGPWARGGESNLRGFDPADVPLYGDHRPFGGHPSGMQAGMADGSIRFISASVEPQKLAAAITIAGGETVVLD